MYTVDNIDLTHQVVDPCTSHLGVTALQPGEMIWYGCYLASANERFSAELGVNGNFVVYDNNQEPKVEVWSTGTAALLYEFQKLVIQNDGNIVLFKTDKNNCGATTAVWASNTVGNRHRLVLQDDGALCAVNADCTGDNCGNDWCSPSAHANEWEDTTWSEYPFMVFLHVTKSNENGDKSYGGCGGSIIAIDQADGKGVILTAAHCVTPSADQLEQGYVLERVIVFVGLDGYTSEIIALREYSAYVATPDSVLIHEGYDVAFEMTGWKDDDIALIFLSEAIDHSGAEKIELLSDLSVIRNNDGIHVLGYLGGGASDEDTLEYADTNYLNDTACAAEIDNIEGLTDEAKDIYKAMVIGGHEFCIEDRTGTTQTVCRGDSGSPSTFNGKQIGVNSWAFSDCDPDNPQMLVSVPHYYDWIESQCPGCVGMLRV